MYTVKQVSEITGISSHTLRFYDKENLFPFVSRSEKNVRLFSENDLAWVNLVNCFRATGMSLPDIRRYIELCIEGKTTTIERYNIILKQKEKAEEDVIEMQKRVEMLKKKLDHYDKLIEEETSLIEDKNNEVFDSSSCSCNEILSV